MAKKTKKSLLSVSGDLCFWVSNGQVLKNLSELRSALKEMNDDTFFYHANQEKNDFAKWAEEALQDLEAAKKLFKAKNRAEAVKALDTYLKNNF